MTASYTIENGFKKLVLDDGSKVDVIAPLSLDEGQFVRLIASQMSTITSINTGLSNLNTTLGANNAQAVLNAPDLAIAYTYFDQGTANQRINTATYTSASVGYRVVDTYVYGGTVPNFYVVSTSRVTNAL
jgi:hypothetical protein